MLQEVRTLNELVSTAKEVEVVPDDYIQEYYELSPNKTIWVDA